jgi:carboxyl-terminal processing protease
MFEKESMMERHPSTSLARIFLMIVLACALVLTSFVAGAAVGVRWSGQSPQTQQSGVSAANPDPSAATAAAPASDVSATLDASAADQPIDLGLFGEAWRLLQKQFYGALPERKQVTYDAIKGVVDRLGDPHTAFVDPQEAALLNADMEGHFEGIGARVDLAEGGGVEIKYLFAGQPAEKAGLQVGDVIVAVDGKDVTRLGLTEAITLIRGPQGSNATLRIRRGDHPPLDLKVTRDRIEIPVVESAWLADGRIAHVTLSEFSSVAPDRLAAALRDALGKKPAGVILDLRGNPGGLLDAAVRIGSYFVDKGPIVVERSKDGTEQVYDRQGPYLLGTTPLVVLVDAGSASASEIVAGAVQDAGSGTLIGETTFGKGSVQLPNTLSDGSQLRVTTAHWFTPRDRAIDGIGLAPDIAVQRTQEDYAAKRDPQLDRAVEYLLQGK